MKKLLSMILAVSLVLFSFAAFAETESVVEPLGGVIVEIGEEGLLLDQGDGNYVVVHMEESTPITGVEELEAVSYTHLSSMASRSAAWAKTFMPFPRRHSRRAKLIRPLRSSPAFI